MKTVKKITISFNPWMITVVLLFCRANLHFWFCKVLVGILVWNVTNESIAVVSYLTKPCQFALQEISTNLLWKVLHVYKLTLFSAFIRQLQEFSTKGASDVDFFSSGSDHFLVFANSRDNNGETLVTVDVYRWDNTTRLFTPSPWQSLENQGAAAVAVVNIEGVTYMAVANNYNSKLKTYTVQYVWLLEFWAS